MINQIKTVLLLGTLSGLLLVIGYFVGGMNGLGIMFGISILFNLFTYLYSHKIVLMMYRAKEISKKDNPWLHEAIESICKEAKLPKPKIYIVPTETPNAFATGPSPKKAAVAVTNGILKLLSKNELKGVLAHEIAHVKNRDTLITTIAAMIGSAISFAAFMLRMMAVGQDRDRGSPIALLLLGILAPIAAMIIQLAISRAREYIADESGARFIKDPLSLANALIKIESSVYRNPLKFGSPATSSLFIINPFKGSGMSFLNLFSTHPPVKFRVERLRRIKV
ncbi:zinc metalloprotease HtpX [Candidatus Woesearchaeota archaeon]|nr:zinc metalloprotease HtpX [Candidatus Woesearchaeota archaeon]